MTTTKNTKQTPKPSVVAEKLNAATKDAKADAPVLIEDHPAKRSAAAKQEFKAEQEWEKGGRKGARPATPNLDYLREKSANGGVEPKRKSSSNGNGSRTRLGPRGLMGAEAYRAANKKRGATKKLSDAEFIEYVAKVRAAHPESSMMDELWYAQWVEKIATSKARFESAWNGTLTPKAATPKASASTKPTKAPAKATTKATTKAAPAKVQPTKKQPATKAAPAKSTGTKAPAKKAQPTKAAARKVTSK